MRATVGSSSRDTPLERGLLALGMPLKREAIADAPSRISYLTLASLDHWAGERQRRRRFREHRNETFAKVNEHLRRIRALGRDESEPRGK